MLIYYIQCIDLNQRYWIWFYRSLYLNKKGLGHFEGKADLLVLALIRRLVSEGRSKVYELSYMSRFVVKFFNIIVYPSFMNSTTAF